MKTKKITIEVRTLDDALKEAGDVFEKPTKGQVVAEKGALYFPNLKEMRRVLTEKRLKLLRTIKHKKPSSVYELSRILNRDLKNVLQDVAYLADLGIVKVEETKGKKVPSVAYDRIAFEVAI